MWAAHGDRRGVATMTAVQHSKLRAMLMRVGAEDLAMEVAAVEDVRDLDGGRSLYEVKLDVAPSTQRA